MAKRYYVCSDPDCNQSGSFDLNTTMVNGCPKCGKPAIVYCPHCEAPLITTKQKFCTSCKQPLQAK